MPSPQPTPGSRGFIIPIGGAEDKLHDRRILQKFIDVSGGAEARVVIIPTASQLDSTGPRYQEVFYELGAQRVDVLDYRERNDTENLEWLERLQNATGAFMTGGNQLRLATILGGTDVATLLRRNNAQGMAVAGTSAGAAFVSEHMIAHGRSGATPRAGHVSLAAGLGLTNRVIIDQHFRQRDRIGRLMTALAYNPFAIGLGLDEDTAAFIDADRSFEVVGAGAITVVDASDLAYSGMADARDGDAIDLIGLRLHVLTNGACYNLDSRVATPPPSRREVED